MMEGYAALLRAANVSIKTLDIPDEDHFSVLAKLGDPKSEVHQIALAMMR
jgi:hypothetical protein